MSTYINFTTILPSTTCYVAPYVHYYFIEFPSLFDKIDYLLFHKLIAQTTNLIQCNQSSPEALMNYVIIEALLRNRTLPKF